jgi:hypothetical protein
MFRRSAVLAVAAPGPPLEAGEQEVVAAVTATFALEPV